MVKSRLQDMKMFDSLPALVDSGRNKRRGLLLPNNFVTNDFRSVFI
jgi:hypothetical protein